MPDGTLQQSPIDRESILREAETFLDDARVTKAPERVQRDSICLYLVREDDDDEASPMRAVRAFTSVIEAEGYREYIREDRPTEVRNSKLYVVSLHSDRFAQGSRFRGLIADLASLVAAQETKSQRTLLAHAVCEEVLNFFKNERDADLLLTRIRAIIESS